MISFTDLLFLLGMSVAIGAAWYMGVPQGVAATGLGVCVGAMVVRYLQIRKRKR